MIKLSPRRLATLAFVGSFMRQQGKAPTMREIGAHLGVGSTNAVNDLLRALERGGFVTCGVAQARSLALTELGWRRLGFMKCAHCGSLVEPGKAVA